MNFFIISSSYIVFLDLILVKTAEETQKKV